MPKPVKQTATISDHIALLRKRGMEVDTDLAEQWLSFVSYYRLSAYWYPAREMTNSGVRKDTFVPGTKFSDAVALYEADRKLRSLVHDGMERIEIALRTRIGEVLCKNDPLAYLDPKSFRPSFDHQGWMKTIQKRLKRVGSRNESIKHYKAEYAGKYPFWVLAEVLDFADISRLFSGLPASDQRQVTEDLGVTIDLSRLSRNQQRKAKQKPPLVRWTQQLTIVRNFCAHHARLWNKSFTPVPTEALRTLPQFSNLPGGQSEQIFGALIVMAALVRTASPGTTWPEKVTNLVRNDFLKNPLVRQTGLGIPDGANFNL